MRYCALKWQRKAKILSNERGFVALFCELDKYTGMRIYLIILSLLSLTLNMTIFNINLNGAKDGINDSERSR